MGIAGHYHLDMFLGLADNLFLQIMNLRLNPGHGLFEIQPLVRYHLFIPAPAGMNLAGFGAYFPGQRRFYGRMDILI